MIKKDTNFEIREISPTLAKKICQSITASLPEWFGIPEANERYAQGMLKRLSLAAYAQNQCIGMITLEFPYPNNANIYWIAVEKNHHGKGIGKKLLSAAEDYCRNKKCYSFPKLQANYVHYSLTA